MIILAKKNKLGKFGEIFIRQLFKVHRGKRKYYVYFTIIITTIFFGTVIFAIENAKANYSLEIEEIKTLLPETPNLEDAEQTTEFINKIVPKLTPEEVFLGLFFLIIMPFQNPDAFFILWGITDQATDGWYLHFSTVIFIENLEMAGILIYTRMTIKKNTTIL